MYTLYTAATETSIMCMRVYACVSLLRFAFASLLCTVLSAVVLPLRLLMLPLLFLLPPPPPPSLSLLLLILLLLLLFAVMSEYEVNLPPQY